MNPENEWHIVEAAIGTETLEESLNRQNWSRYGYDVFQILTNPDRVVFRKAKKPLSVQE